MCVIIYRYISYGYLVTFIIMYRMHAKTEVCSYIHIYIYITYIYLFIYTFNRSIISTWAIFHGGSRLPSRPGLLGELRQQPSEKRPKLGAYQRWVRELDVAEGDPQESLGRAGEGLTWRPASQQRVAS